LREIREGCERHAAAHPGSRIAPWAVNLIVNAAMPASRTTSTWSSSSGSRS
jgi:hypothetical protein